VTAPICDRCHLPIEGDEPHDLVVNGEHSVFHPACCPECRAEAAALQRTAARTYRIARMAVSIADTRDVVAHVQRDAAHLSRSARLLMGVTA